MRPHFESYVAIDWSGAKGNRHKGIAIAEAKGDGSPRLVRPGHVWSREEVLGWLLPAAQEGSLLWIMPGMYRCPSTAQECIVA